MAPVRALRRITLLCALVLWGFAVTSGAFLMFGYASTPGVDARAPLRWPNASLLQRKEDAFTLLFFAHPKCPCTNASLEQLLRVLTAAKLPVDCHVIFTIPEDADEHWTDTPLVRRAEAVPDVRIRRDHFATETHRFHVATSGHVLLYEPSGRLLFSGGLTDLRGHAGDSVGGQTLLEFLTGMQPPRDRTPIYGCPLLNDQAQEGAAECAEACPWPA